MNWRVKTQKTLAMSLAVGTLHPLQKKPAGRVSWIKNYIIICDGLNTHKSEGLVKLVAQECSITVDPGIKGKRGILESMKSQESFLMDESHRIRFVYTPKHSSWVNQIEKRDS